MRPQDLTAAPTASSLSSSPGAWSGQPCPHGQDTTGCFQAAGRARQQAPHSHEACEPWPGSATGPWGRLPVPWLEHPPKATRALTLIGCRKKWIFHGYLETSEKMK